MVVSDLHNHLHAGCGDTLLYLEVTLRYIYVLVSASEMIQTVRQGKRNSPRNTSASVMSCLNVSDASRHDLIVPKASPEPLPVS